MIKYFLAIDIGASSGRHILGCVRDNKIELEEVYRFWNGMDDREGTLCWDIDRLFDEILTGMKKCAQLGKFPESVGIDTWGVDYVLLDANNQVIGQAVGYRDKRTENMDREVFRILNEDELYERTGIQKAIYNTIYQLMAVKKQRPKDMELAETLLMMPDYFHYKLCGNKVQEYTEATTSQLINVRSKDWDYALIGKLGFKQTLFQKICMPGTVIGTLQEEIRKVVGYTCKVVLPPSHDTAAAVMAIPSSEENICYISSGTWSLMGIERIKPDSSPKSRKANFTNEGGYQGRYTYLTNIMGLWMIQSVRKELAPDMKYDELCKKASMVNIKSIVDCQDTVFLSPKSMVTAIEEYCRDSHQQVPTNLFEIAAVVYNSLANCYAEKLKEIEKLMGCTYKSIHVIGGGSKAGYLNHLTARYTKVTVEAGPAEATAIGNILAQMIQSGEFLTLKEARACVAESFNIQRYYCDE